MEHFTKKIDELKCKQKFKSWVKANKEAEKFNTHSDNFGKKRLGVYKCKICDFFHIGSSTNNINTVYVNKTKVKIFSKLINKITNVIDLEKIDPKKMKRIEKTKNKK